MDGLSDSLSAYPLTLDQATGGSDWGNWIDRLAGYYFTVRAMKQQDALMEDGQPKYAGVQTPVGTLNVGAILAVVAVGTLVWFAVKK